MCIFYIFFCINEARLCSSIFNSRHFPHSFGISVFYVVRAHLLMKDAMGGYLQSNPCVCLLSVIGKMLQAVKLAVS